MNFTSTLRVTIDARGAQTGARQVEQSQRKIQDATKKTEASAFRLRRTLYDLRFALVSIGGIAITRGIFRLNDAFTEQESKIRLVTSSERQLTAVRQQLFDLSQRTRTQMDATVTLFQRMSQATEAMNLSDAERIRLTETINKAVRISGATTQEAEGAIRQLTQAIASGVLRGQEYNSVNEQTQRIMKILRDELGVTQGELRNMANTGQITTEVMMQAIANAAQQIDAEFANMERTVSQAFVQLANSMGMAVGMSSEFDSLSEVVIAGADGIRNVVDGASESFDALVEITSTSLIIVLATQVPAAFTAAGGATVALTAKIAALRVATLSMLAPFITIPAIIAGAATALGLWIKSGYDAERAMRSAHQASVDLADGFADLSASDQDAGFETIRQQIIDTRVEIMTLEEELENSFLAKLLGEENMTFGRDIAEARERLQELNQALVEMRAVRGEEIWEEWKSALHEYFVEGEQVVAMTAEQIEAFQKLRDAVWPLEAAHEELQAQIGVLQLAFANDKLSAAEYAEAVRFVTAQYVEQTPEARALAEEQERLEQQTEDLTRAKEDQLRVEQAMIASSQQQLGTFEGVKQSLLEQIQQYELTGEALREARLEAEIFAATSQFMGSGLPVEELEALVRKLFEYREAAETANEGQRALSEQAEESARIMEQVWGRALSSLDEAFVDLWGSALRGFDDFADSIKNALRDLLARLAHMAITQPIMLQLGASLGIPGASAGAAALSGAGGMVGGGGMLGGLIGGGLSLGGSGLLGGALFGNPVLSPFTLAPTGLTTGGLLSGLSGFSGGIGAGLSTFGSSLTGGLGGLAALGSWTGIGLLLAGLTGAIGRISNNNTNPSSQISFGQPRGGRDALLTSDFGDIYLGSGRDGFISDFMPEVQEAFSVMFDAIASIVTEEQQEAITQILQGMGDIQITREMLQDGTFLEPVFNQMLRAFDPAIQRLVEEAGESIEDRMNALGAALQLEAFVEAEGTFASLGEAVAALGQYQLEGEELADTLVRVVSGMNLLESAFDVLGIAGTDLGGGMMALAADFTEAAGGIQRATGLWNSFFDMYLSEAERADFLRVQLERQARDELADVGLVDDLSTYTREGLRRMFEELLPSLTGEELKEWLEALRAFGIFIENTVQVASEIQESQALPTIGTFPTPATFEYPGEGEIRTPPPPPGPGPYTGGYHGGGGDFDPFPVVGLPGPTFGATVPGLQAPVDMASIAQQIRDVEADITAQALGAVATLFGTQVERLNEEIARWQAVSQGSTMGMLVGNAQLDNLIAERDAIVEQQRRAQELATATGLAQNIADLSGIRGTSFSAVAESLGFDLNMLGQTLGMEMPALLSHLEDLQADSVTMTSLSELVNGVGTTITDAFHGVFGEEGQSFSASLKSGADTMLAAAAAMQAAADTMLASTDRQAAPRAPVAVPSRPPSRARTTA